MRFEFGEFQLDDKRFALTGPSGPVHVEPQVFELLRFLIVNRDRVVSKEELLDSVWGNRFVSESALTSRVKAARRAVGDDGQAQRVIKNVHGRGYQFVAQIHVEGGRAHGAIPRLRSGPVGRDSDITSVAQRLEAAPLVTITGPGGIGKTTVALAVAHRLQPQYDDGVVFVDLSPVPPRADVTGAVADAAGVQGDASEAIERVADHLASRALLLVLDNCEHVLEPAFRLVDRMLEAGETARILATSREPLGVVGEHVWPLGPLLDDAPALFVERARAAEPRVDWHPGHPAVIELCRRLDGVPLALELAAGQLRRFDLDELIRRLDDRLTLLSRRGAGDGQRHATMETAIDWSYQLLDGAEQCLLRHLGVFPSSFDVAAVEASAPEMPADPVVVFGQLVDKSLVVRVAGSGRYRLLETIRMFALDRLDEWGERAAAFERHRRKLVDRVRSASRLDRWMSARRAAAFRTDLEDARQAFRLSAAGGHARDALDIALGASFLWRNTLGCSEGNRWVDDFLRLDLSAEDQIWVQVLRADVGQGRGVDRQMFAAASTGTRLAKRVNDPVAACLLAHFAALAYVVDVTRARGRWGAAHDVALQSGDRRLITLVDAYGSAADLAQGGETTPVPRWLGSTVPHRRTGTTGSSSTGPGGCWGSRSGTPWRPGAGWTSKMTTWLAPASPRPGSRRSPRPCATCSTAATCPPRWLGRWHSPTGRGTRPTPTACSRSPTPRPVRAGWRPPPSCSGPPCRRDSMPPPTMPCTGSDRPSASGGARGRPDGRGDGPRTGAQAGRGLGRLRHHATVSRRVERSPAGEETWP